MQTPCTRHAQRHCRLVGQAVDQAQRGGEEPVLFYRLDHAEWRAVWGLGLHLGAEWTGYAMTVEGSVLAWAAAARDLHEGGGQKCAGHAVQDHLVSHRQNFFLPPEGQSEPPRFLRRLQSLRGWSHEEVTQVFTRGP
jgi:hypothetical protein